MTIVTIIGAGNIAQGVARIATAGGNAVQILARDADKAAAAAESVQGGSISSGRIGEALTGEIVVLAVPYPAVTEVLETYGDAVTGKILVDPTNPLDFSTFDDLVVPADASAAAQLQAQLPGARVLKAFNTTFAGTLATGKVGDLPTTVLIAGDDGDAKATLASVIEGGGLVAVDAGSLKRARELEALGFLQLTLAAQEKVSWTGGFGVVR